MIALLMLACNGPTHCEASGQALETTWHVRYQAKTCDAAVGSAVQGRLEEITHRLSIWQDDSEVHKVRAGQGAVQVSEETFEVVSAALDLASASQGAFDPTIEPLMQVWGFHSEGGVATPKDEALKQALAAVGWDRVRIGRDGMGPWVNAGGTQLDLSALLEGHAADRIAYQLATLGISNHVVTVGGEVRVTGSGPNGAWRLGLDVGPDDPHSDVVFTVRNGAVATAGLGRNPVIVDGVEIYPTMDPSTGRPAVSDVRTVAVFAPTTREADGLATAVAVMGSSRGLALLNARPDVEALIFTESPEPLMTSGAAVYLVP